MNKKGIYQVQKLKDGIAVDRTIKLTDGNGQGLLILVSVIQFMVIILGCYSALGIFIDCFSLPVKYHVVQIVVLLGGILLYFLYTYPAYDIFKIVIGLIMYLLFIRWKYNQIENAFYIIENAILSQASEYYNFYTRLFIADYSTARVDVTILIIVILVPFLCLIAHSVIRCKAVIITVLIYMIPAMASFAFGVTPDETYFIIFLLAMIYLMRSYYNSKGNYRIGKNQRNRLIYSRSAMVLIIIVITLFFLLKLVVPEKKYEAMVNLKDTKVELQTFLSNLSLEDLSQYLESISILPSKNGDGNGGVSEGKLGEVGTIIFTGEEQLKITIPKSSLEEGMYLKGYVGTVYSKNQWGGHTDTNKQRYQKVLNSLGSKSYHPMAGLSSFLYEISELESLLGTNYSSETLNMSLYELHKGSMKIEYKGANKNYFYTPYTAIYKNMDNLLYVNDLYIKPQRKQGKYEIEFLYDLNIDKQLNDYIIPEDGRLLDFSLSEKAYRDFVYSTYVNVPRNELQTLKAEFAKLNIEEDTDTLENAIAMITTYLHGSTEYSLSPGKLPKDKDFVEYFLFEKKVGFCVHYASAGTLMLRMMGYPARYVEGYVVNPLDVIVSEDASTQQTEIITNRKVYNEGEGEITVSVKDYSAHAWVEVYIDGVGWMPVEFTPGAGLSGTSDSIQGYQQFSENITTEEDILTPTPEPTPTPESEEEEIAPTPTPTKAPEQELNSESSLTKEGNHNQSYWLWIFALLLVLIPIMIFIFDRMRKKGTVSNRSKKAISIYVDMEKMLRRSGYITLKSTHLEDDVESILDHCPYIEEMDFLMWMELIQKARFSQNILNKSELKYIALYYDEIRARILTDYSWIRRFWHRILLMV